jgi:hypothetical protein
MANGRMSLLYSPFTMLIQIKSLQECEIKSNLPSMLAMSKTNKHFLHIHFLQTYSGGGAAITPNHGEWKNVTAIFPLHDVDTNKKWIRAWSQFAARSSWKVWAQHCEFRIASHVLYGNSKPRLAHWHRETWIITHRDRLEYVTGYTEFAMLSPHLPTRASRKLRLSACG